MFPTLQYNVIGLDLNQKYNVFVDIVPCDGNLWKYHNGRWIPSTQSNAAAPKNPVYMHPDSPNTGLFWMSKEIVFNKVRLTNNKSNSAGSFLLNSFHRYLTRVHIAPDNDNAKVRTFAFVETEFIAVTAYQNTAVTQLKIDNNPYAKGFRDNADRVTENNMLISASRLTRAPDQVSSATAGISSYYQQPATQLEKQHFTSTPKILETRYPNGMYQQSWHAYPNYQSPGAYNSYYASYNSSFETSRGTKRARYDDDQENLHANPHKVPCTLPGFYPPDSANMVEWSS